MFGKNKQLEEALSTVRLEYDQVWWPELETLLQMKMPGYNFWCYEDSESEYFGINDAADMADFLIRKRNAEDIQVCIWQSTDGDITYLIVGVKEKQNE